MTPSEYRDLLSALHLTQAGAARLLGVNEVTARRWAADGDWGRAIPPPAARFLRFLHATRIKPMKVFRALGEPFSPG
jgi:DNA-binding transcriptional regulator YiaG